MKLDVIKAKQIENRNNWIEKISILSGNFGVDTKKVECEIAREIKDNGLNTLIGHIRLCGAIPENYGHDSSEEKLYSKYTDVIIHEAYLFMGFKSIVLKERADVADVECVNEDYSFVADAKAFRLSRTAKNQKDFKVQAMDGWKHGKPFAMVVCPVYQLPARTSQIYQQAAERSVCISTYTHIAVLTRYAQERNQSKSMDLLHKIFKAVEAMNPSKNASTYWQIVNSTMLEDDKIIVDIWREEKIASIESIYVSKEEALHFWAKERERIMKLSKEAAIQELLKLNKIDNKIRAVKAVADNNILGAR